MFCLWHYPELDRLPPPVVYFGSEGQTTAVVATDARTFIELLATGRVWGDPDGTFDDDEQPPAHALFAAAERRRFGFFRSRTAEEIQQEGASAHPDFKARVELYVPLS